MEHLDGDNRTARLPGARVTQSLRDHATELAERLGIRLSTLVRRAVVAYLDRERGGPEGSP